ncbi:hypothetical protein Q8A67_008131 [Cirrhinus molitorella]|uniref:Uncharacterized protein n=1 Tax=Cirrhinus molitorella TaxID=172907 RepID=A0AA88PW64_9TELE|nr:hypothetical protein Q8A67_008131 [Cirrhinus molitorella]
MSAELSVVGWFWIGAEHSPDTGGSLPSSSVLWCLGGPLGNADAAIHVASKPFRGERLEHVIQMNQFEFPISSFNKKISGCAQFSCDVTASRLRCAVCDQEQNARSERIRPTFKKDLLWIV